MTALPSNVDGPSAAKSCPPRLGLCCLFLARGPLFAAYSLWRLRRVFVWFAAVLLTAALLTGLWVNLHRTDGKRQLEEDSRYAPAALPLAVDAVTRLVVAEPSGASPQLDFPVGIALRGAEQYYVCNYQQLFLVDLAESRAWEIAPPPDLTSKWVPTGLASDIINKKLYVATYTGGNVLVFDTSEKTKVKLAGILADPELKGPEGVAVSDDGRWVAVADYDGNQACLFDAEGRLHWRYPVHGCHGITCGRLPGEQRFVVATSLGDPSLVKFDWDGHLLRKVGHKSWRAPNSYLYPTAVVTRSDGLVAATDAFRGQITFVDEELSTFGVLGGNGPDPGLFNNPYACCWNAKGDRLVVADTFKGRLVEVDPVGRVVTRISRLTDYRARHPAMMDRFANSDETDTLAVRLLPGFQQRPTAEPFGIHYHDEVDPSTTVSLPLPRFRAGTARKCGTDWHPAISGLSAAADRRVHLHCGQFCPLWTDYPYRFVFARNYEYAGHAYLLLSSPQSRVAFVCGRGIIVPVPLQKDTWLVGDTLIGQDYVLAARRVVETAAPRIDALLHDHSQRLPLEIIRAALTPNLSPQEFRQTAISRSSPDGAGFIKTCFEAENADAQRGAAEVYVNECCRRVRQLGRPGEPVMAEMSLAELALAEMILAIGTEK